MLAVIAILSALSVVSVGLISSASSAYASASSQRESVDRLSFAMERVVNSLREAPPGAQNGQPGITLAATFEIRFNDNSGFFIRDNDLWMVAADSTEAPLCRDIDIFALSYFGDDGVTDTIATPEQTQRIQIRLGADGLELRTAVFLRVALGS